MSGYTVSLALFITCVCAIPESDKAKVSVIRDSTLGFALAAGGSKTAGIQIGNGNFKVQVQDVARKRPDFSFLENVNSGIAFGFDHSISVGVLKDNLFAGKNPFFRRK
uniref:Attacin C-terminal domain-containing protein n=1 Tax=Heliothis virescens TaxID=7102 RepID=A0A2A4JGT8_HELVI